MFGRNKNIELVAEEYRKTGFDLTLCPFGRGGASPERASKTMGKT